MLFPLFFYCFFLFQIAKLKAVLREREKEVALGILGFAAKVVMMRLKFRGVTVGNGDEGNILIYMYM